MKKTILPVILFSTLSLFGEVLKEWSFDDGKFTDIQIMKPVKAKILSEKAPDGSTAASFTLTEDTLGKKPWDCCLRFKTKQDVVAGTKYVYKFYAKSETKTTFSANCQMLTAPWKYIGGGKKFTLTDEWQEFSVEFKSGISASGSAAMPHFFFGDMPKGTSMTLSKMTLEKKLAFLPASLVKPQWIFFPNPKFADGKIPEINSIPSEFGGVKGIPVTASDGQIDLTKYASFSAVRTPGFLMQVIDADQDGEIQIGCSADWWFDFIVNGKSVYNTLDLGNCSAEYKPEDHVFNFQVRKGKNLIIVNVLNGMKGWRFVYGSVPFREKLRKITTIVRGKEWRPVKMGNHVWSNKDLKALRIDEFKIIPGSPLDLSQYLPRYDIDKMGHLKADAAGRFYFENAPGTMVRLRGFNNTYGIWDDRFWTFSKKEIEELAEEIRLRGMNVLRFHFWDRCFVGKNGFLKQGKETTEDVLMAQNVSELPLDQKFVDRYFYFVKCLRDRGIYIMIDIFTSNSLMTQATSRSNKVYSRFELFYNQKYRNHFRTAAEFWLKTVNPYTGKRLADDPQLIAITFFNEQEHLFNAGSSLAELFTPYWRKAINDPNAPVFNFKLLSSNDETGRKARKFLQNAVDDINAFYAKTIRDMGFKGFLTNWDMFMRNLEGHARRYNDAVAMHTYHAHPSETKLVPATYKQRLSFGRWLRNKMRTNDQSSSIVSNNYIGRAAVTRVLGKPFIMDEFSHATYNQHISEEAVMWSAYASLQDWQMLAPHANSVKLYYVPLRPGFADAINISAQVSSLCYAFAWQRGDVKSAEHAVSFHIPEKVLDSPDYISAIGSGYNSLYMLTRVGSDYVQSKNPQATLNIEPESFVNAASMGMWVKLQEENEKEQKILPNQVEKLREANILPKNNLTDLKKGIFQSETGEIIADLKNHSVTVDAPKFQAAAVKPGLKFKLSQLEVNSASTPCSIIAIALDQAKSVAESRHLLLVVNTMFVAENAVFSTPNFDAELDIGDMQLVTKAGKFDFSVKSNVSGTPKCYALNLNGSREHEIALKKENGKLNFKLDTSLFKYGTPYFELTFD